MTGEKNRYSTVEKLWKLDDETLKTPKHDELVLWLLQKKNFLSLFSPYTLTGRFSAHTDRVEDLASIHDHLGDKIFWDFLKTKECYKDIPDTLQDFWFAVIQEYHEFVSDVHAYFSDNAIIVYKAKSEVPISTHNHFIVGYWDLEVTLKFPPPNSLLSRSGYFLYTYWYEGEQEERRRLYIEVKPRIDSFGATLRQLNTYQDYVRDAIGKIYLFTPDLRFKDAFESQGIKVISPP